MSSTASLCVVVAAALLLLVLGLGAPGSEAANCTNQKRRKDNYTMALALINIFLCGCVASTFHVCGAPAGTVCLSGSCDSTTISGGIALTTSDGEVVDVAPGVYDQEVSTLVNHTITLRCAPPFLSSSSLFLRLCPVPSRTGGDRAPAGIIMIKNRSYWLNTDWDLFNAPPLKLPHDNQAWVQ